MKFGKFERSKERAYWRVLGELEPQLILEADCFMNFSLYIEELYLVISFLFGLK